MSSGAGALAVLGAAALTLFGIFFTDGSLAVAVAPALALTVVYLAVRAPLRTCVAILLFLALVADSPQDNPMGGHWQSPLYLLGELLCNNWSNSFGVSALSFSGLDLFTALLLLRSAMSAAGAGTALILRRALLLFFVSIVALGAFGAVTGGAMGNAYWQVRQFIYVPVFAWLLTRALQGSDDHLLLGRLVVGAALVKTAFGLFFHFAIALPRGLNPPFLTTHSDTMLFCLAINLVLVRFLEQPDLRSLRRLWIIPVVFWAVWLNNRRIAYVGLFGSFAVVWLLTSWNRVKRNLLLGAFLALPFVALYVAAGWGSKAPAFKPVASIRSMVATKDGTRADDSSTRSRQTENYNLAQTLRMHPLGTGLGHPYEEVVKGPDISKDFALYRYIPHNSVLWMMAAGGPVGFFLIWSLFVVGIYLAARSRRQAEAPLDRMAAIAAICAQLLFLVQAWGDMGTQNWSTTWLLAAALAVSGRLALQTGAWPSALSAPPPMPAAG